MVMTGMVLRVNARSMLVRDLNNGQQVLVNFGNARSFRVGDTVRIAYNGAMTFSVPPQITATSVTRMMQPQQGNRPQGPMRPPMQQSEIRRAQVLQVGRGSLTVRNPANNQNVVVNYPYAHHFCVRQRVNIFFNAITLTNPAQVSATDITPVC